MRKFNQSEYWALGVALENFRKAWKEEGRGNRSLFTDDYIDYFVDEIKEKIDEVTLKKALKQVELEKKKAV